MIDAVSKTDCYGCGACVQRCPKKCIILKSDKQGFLYPVLDRSRCVDCGLCSNVCPALIINKKSVPNAVYAAINPCDEIRKLSSSGGVFSLLAEFVFKRGGVVFGARFDDNWNVVHDYATSMDELRIFRGSKYLQSSIANCYNQVESFLKQGLIVLFSGTPCQVGGLNSFLGKKYDNLLLVDVVCHGVPSSLVWQSYLDYTFGFKRNTIKDINFRDKSFGWKGYHFTIKFANSCFHELYKENLYMRGFLANLFLRPSCYDCRVKCGRSRSDITLGDLWGARVLCPRIDDDKGIGLLLVNSEKAENIINMIDCNLYPIDYHKVLFYNRLLNECAEKPEQYNWFWKKFGKKGCAVINDAINWRPSLFVRGIRKIRNILSL